MLINIEVNNKILKVKKGETILLALKAHGINIPTICSMRDFTPTGACRMCVVEIDGMKSLVTSCSHPVEEWMKIKTHSPRIVKARKSIVELLLSNHPDDCLYCVRNTNCELQDLASELGVLERRIFGRKNKFRLDHSSLAMVRDPAKCILCSRCVRVCSDIQAVHALEFQNRGNKTFIGTSYNKDLNFSSCILCGQCIMVCPTAALHENEQLNELAEALNDSSKTVIVQLDPSVSVTLAEEFGHKPGKEINGILVAALRKIGFNIVFDTAFGVDLYIMELVSEFINNRENGNRSLVFTGLCPAWVKYAEQFWPDYLPNISEIKSPPQLLGSVIKNYYAKRIGVYAESIYSVEIAPCVAKKFESQREEMTSKGISDIDCVLTTREFVKLIKLHGIDLDLLEAELPDDPFETRSSAGKISAVSGGITEAFIRTLYFKLTGEELSGLKIQELRGLKGKKEYKQQINDKRISFVAVSGLNNAKTLIEELKLNKSKYDFIEVMACPGGCINGGGQPVRPDEGCLKSRMKTLYELDEKEVIRVAHKNPKLIALTAQFKELSGEGLNKEQLNMRFMKRNVLL